MKRKGLLLLLLIPCIVLGQFPEIDMNGISALSTDLSKEINKSKAGEVIIASFNIRNLRLTKRTFEDYQKLADLVDESDIVVGWLFMGALFIPMFCILIYLLIKDPDLLVKRMKTKEKEKTQKTYLILSIIVCLITFIVPGLDFRYNWSDVPLSVILISTIIMMSGYLMFFIVMKQNTYASRVIEIQNEQKLIDTGLYSFVRHPMYLAATILYRFAPLVLGSFYGLIPMAFIPVLLIIRIKNEENVLLNGLKG